jgi:hypothetical protein
MNVNDLPSVKVESHSDVSNDEQEAGKITSRARLRIGELLERPFGVRSIALTGLFILAIFYTIYFMRSILLPIVLALLLSFLFRPIVRGLAKLKIPLSVSAAFILIGLLALVGYGISGHARSGMAPKSTGRFDGIATQAPAGKKIGSASDPGDRRNREAGRKQCGN